MCPMGMNGIGKTRKRPFSTITKLERKMLGARDPRFNFRPVSMKIPGKRSRTQVVRQDESPE